MSDEPKPTAEQLSRHKNCQHNQNKEPSFVRGDYGALRCPHCGESKSMYEARKTNPFAGLYAGMGSVGGVP